MSSRHQQVTLFIVGCTFISVVTLLFLLNRTHTVLDNTREALRGAEAKYAVLYEYKTRLESAFLNLKTEKASLVHDDITAKQELVELKQLYAKQMETLMSELELCKTRGSEGGKNPENLHENGPHISLPSPVPIKTSANESSQNKHQHSIIGRHKAKSPHLKRLSSTSSSSAPNLQLEVRPLAIVHEGHKQQLISGGSGSGTGAIVNGQRSPPEAALFIVRDQQDHAIQSPIGLVPAQPSGDPNDDVVGNVLI